MNWSFDIEIKKKIELDSDTILICNYKLHYTSTLVYMFNFKTLKMKNNT